MLFFLPSFLLFTCVSVIHSVLLSLTRVFQIMPPIDQNGPGFQYLLEYKRVGDNDVNKKTENLDDWRQYKIRIPSGDIYTAYEITLKATNSIGEASATAQTIIGYSGEDSE